MVVDTLDQQVERADPQSIVRATLIRGPRSSELFTQTSRRECVDRIVSVNRLRTSTPHVCIDVEWRVVVASYAHVHILHLYQDPLGSRHTHRPLYCRTDSHTCSHSSRLGVWCAIQCTVQDSASVRSSLFDPRLYLHLHLHERIA